MAIIRWDPFRNISTLQDRINRLFEDAFPQQTDLDDSTVCAWRPLVDIYEAEQGVVILADLPGVEKEDVSVEVKDFMLTIRGQRRAEPVVRDEHYYRRERICGTFLRAFTLRSMVAPESIRASFKNGVLKIEIPKPDEEKSRKVAVTIE